MAGVFTEYITQLRTLINKIKAYFSTLPNKDPKSLYSWIAIGVGLILVITSFFV